MTDRRYFVTLSATCAPGDLHAVVEHLSTQLAPLVNALPEVEGVSLSFTRDDAETFTAETVALPVTPAPTVGVVEPPSTSTTVAGEQLPTAPVPTRTDGSPA